MLCDVLMKRKVPHNNFNQLTDIKYGKHSTHIEVFPLERVGQIFDEKY